LKFDHLNAFQLGHCVDLIQEALHLTRWLGRSSNAAQRQRFVTFLVDGCDVEVFPDEWEKLIANLEHMLLCLQNILVRTLNRKILGAVLIAALQRHHQRRYGPGGECWAIKFQGSIGPLSTTWPWSIRPSFAVLWGVCWKYFDNAHRERNLRIRQRRQQQNLEAFTSVPDPYELQGRTSAASSTLSSQALRPGPHDWTEGVYESTGDGCSHQLLDVQTAGVSEVAGQTCVGDTSGASRLRHTTSRVFAPRSHQAASSYNPHPSNPFQATIECRESLFLFYTILILVYCLGLTPSRPD